MKNVKLKESIRGSLYLGFILMSLASMWQSCNREVDFESETIELSFSVDTLRFDTVFTSVGTVTRFAKIYNPNPGDIILDQVSLETGNPFRMNVDGTSGSTIENIRIGAQDSIYVFIEATIDPDQPLSISPFVIEDKILVKANSSEYTIHLEAWGQNANYILSNDSAGEVSFLPCTGRVVWDDPKPYVIYGVLVIDACQLIIEKGTRVYIHGGIAIDEDAVYNDGIIAVLGNSSIRVNGTIEEPVTFLSDRLEEEFRETKGQWGGILLQKNSRGNLINNAIIKHAIVGISVDSSAQLVLNNSSIGFTSGNGLVGSHATIAANNCLFYANELSGINVSYGGNYQFEYITIASYDNQSAGLSATNFTCSDPLCLEDIFAFPLQIKVSNSIITGGDDDEIIMVDITEGMESGFYDYSYDHLAIKVEDLLEDQLFGNILDNCSSCITIEEQDSLFIDIDMHDYHLDSLAIAIEQATPIAGITLDLEGNIRDDEKPDIGCYEAQY